MTQEEKNKLKKWLLIGLGGAAIIYLISRAIRPKTTASAEILPFNPLDNPDEVTRLKNYGWNDELINVSLALGGQPTAGELTGKTRTTFVKVSKDAKPLIKFAFIFDNNGKFAIAKDKGTATENMVFLQYPNGSIVEGTYSNAGKNMIFDGKTYTAGWITTNLNNLAKFYYDV